MDLAEADEASVGRITVRTGSRGLCCGSFLHSSHSCCYQAGTEMSSSADQTAAEDLQGWSGFAAGAGSVEGH